MKRIIAALIIFGGLFGALSFSAVASAQEAPPPPCGAAGDLSPELSGNVAADSRCFELRMYTAEPESDGKGGIDNLHQRFREKEVALFEKHGAEVIRGLAEARQPEHTGMDVGFIETALTGTRVFAAFLADPGMESASSEVPGADRNRGLHDECLRLLSSQVVGRPSRTRHTVVSGEPQ